MESVNNKMQAEIILIGDELLRGDRDDKHLVFLAQSLKIAGITIKRCTIIGDDQSGISEMVGRASAESGILIICGGLGPTDDDRTRDGVAGGLGRKLVRNKDAAVRIKEFFERRGYRISSLNEKQAFLPEGAELIVNHRGTAPGFYVRHNACHIFVLPGPPGELRPMVEDFVISRLHRFFPGRNVFSSSYKIAGIGESVLAAKIAPLLSKWKCFEFSSLPSLGEVDIIASASRRGENFVDYEFEAGALEDALRKMLGAKYLGRDKSSIAQVIGEKLMEKNMTLAVAESLTGGGLGKKLTDIPGSSGFFLAGITAYGNLAKEDLLGVKKSTLARYGAVSEEICREMAEGARSKTGAAIAMATTGIAGPLGGTDKKPVGLCYYGLSWDGGSRIMKKRFIGNREDVRRKVTQAVFLLLLEKIEEEP